MLREKNTNSKRTNSRKKNNKNLLNIAIATVKITTTPMAVLLIFIDWRDVFLFDASLSSSNSWNNDRRTESNFLDIVTRCNAFELNELFYADWRTAVDCNQNMVMKLILLFFVVRLFCKALLVRTQLIKINEHRFIYIWEMQIFT